MTVFFILKKLAFSTVLYFYYNLHVILATLETSIIKINLFLHLLDCDNSLIGSPTTTDRGEKVSMGSIPIDKNTMEVIRCPLRPYEWHRLYIGSSTFESNKI
jgi:hypothetical protein